MDRIRRRVREESQERSCNSAYTPYEAWRLSYIDEGVETGESFHESKELRIVLKVEKLRNRKRGANDKL